MTNPNILRLAAEYRAALPDRIREYLRSRGLSDAAIDTYQLGWDGRRITIPITNRDGEIVSFKLAKDPEDQSGSPKMLASRGARLELYGWEEVLRRPVRLVICEGEFDRLVLQSHGFPAVTSIGGAGTFRREWARDFETIEHVYLCFDRDEAGRQGALKVGLLIPHARIVNLPEELGDGGDVTDFFVRLHHTPEDFERLLSEASPVPPALRPDAHEHQASEVEIDGTPRERIERLKRMHEIVDVVSRYVTLRPSPGPHMGLCPFHEDKVPSLAVYTSTQTFYCFGCGKRGDVITFIREVERLSFPAALEFLEAL
jgi:DNA primase